MRFRNPFTLFPRVNPSGIRVFYYHTYTSTGKRTTARSTGQTTVAAARTHCMQLWRENKLIPTEPEQRVPTMNDFAKTFWVPGESAFLKYREQRGYTVSKAHARNQNRYFERYIDPSFGKKKLDTITAPQVETWFLALKDSGLTHQTCNHLLSNLRTILGEAARRGLIPANPVDSIKPLSKNAAVKGILTTDEVKLLFGTDASTSAWIVSATAPLVFLNTDHFRIRSNPFSVDLPCPDAYSAFT